MNITDYDFFKKIAVLPFVEQIWLFGSRARGDHHERSDIDLAILCPKATLQDWHKVLEIIDDADTLLKVDCVRFEDLEDNEKFRQNILSFKKTLYSKDKKLMDPIYWKDYFENLGKSIERLKEVLKHDDLDKIEYMRDAAIQRFEFVIELYWKVLKKVLSYEKIDATTPRDVLRKAFQFNVINDEAIWLAMLDDRNNTSHVYKQEDAIRVFEHIKTYFPVLEKTYFDIKNKYDL